jgi:hypothetical protein
MCNINIYRQAHIKTDGLPIERKRRSKVAFVLPSLFLHNSTKRMPQRLSPSPSLSSSTTLTMSTRGKGTTNACVTDGPKKSSGFAVESRFKTARMSFTKEGDSIAGLVDVSLIRFSSERRDKAWTFLEGLKRKGMMEIITSFSPPSPPPAAATAADGAVVEEEEEDDEEEEVEEEESSLDTSEGFLAARRL